MAGFAPPPAQLAGMAGEIRGAMDSEQFDLAGYNEQRVTDLMTSAFSSPLTAPTKMIRFTFIVGGGKLVRSKYDDTLPKWVNAALRSIKYETDNSAAETFDSQGTFKQQHDTGKNLIYIIVFPHVTCSTVAAGPGEKEAAEDTLDQKTPEYLCTASDLATFKEMVQKKLAFWSQRKACLKILQDAHEQFTAIEQKMCSGQALTPLENALYESNSSNDTEKIAYLQAEIKALVDGGELTANEKTELLASLTKNHAEAVAAGQAKKAETIAARKALLEKATPILGRLRLGDEIQKRYMKLFPLQALEEKARSCSLTISDLQTLSEKSDIELQIAGLEAASRGWFERDEDFLARCEHEQKSAKQRYTQQKAAAVKKGGGLGSKGRPAGTQMARGQNLYANANSWASIGKQRAIAPSGRSTGSSASAKPAQSFANAFGGDDSD